MVQAFVNSNISLTLLRCESRHHLLWSLLTGVSRLPIIIRIQEDCTPEVAVALDALRKEMKNRNLTRNGKPPLRGGEASQDEIEIAIIQALAPLQDTPNFEEIISKTNDYKQTLAHFAVFFGYTSLLRRLMGWNIDLTIADINGFTALHCAYKTGDRVCVDLLLEKGASETVLDALGRAPSHLMPEGFASLNDCDSVTPSDEQSGLEQKDDAPSLQSTDSGHGESGSCDEESMNRAVSMDLMHQSQSSSAAGTSQSILRSPPLPVAPAHPPLSPTPLTPHHANSDPPPPDLPPPLPFSPFPPHSGSVSSLQVGQELPTTSLIHSTSTCTPPGEILAVSADKPSGSLIPMLSDNSQSPRSVYHHQEERTIINQYTSPSPSSPFRSIPLLPSRVSPLPPRYIAPPSTSMFPPTPLVPQRPLSLPEPTTKLSANSQSVSSSEDSSPDIQQPSVGYYEQGVMNSLATQQPSGPFVCDRLNEPFLFPPDIGQATCVPGTQNTEHAAGPQQLDVRATHEPMVRDEAATAPAPQTSLSPTAAQVETNPDNGTTT